MRNFQDTFETLKRLFIRAFSICMTVPLTKIRKIFNNIRMIVAFSTSVCTWKTYDIGNGISRHHNNEIITKIMLCLRDKLIWPRSLKPLNETYRQKAPSS